VVTDQSDAVIPMVRAIVLGPVIQALKTCGEDIGAFLEVFRILPENLNDPSHYIRNDVAYSVFAAAAELRNDPSFCASVGRNMNPMEFMPFGIPLRDAATIGGFFTRFTQAVSAETTSISQRLFVEDTAAYFSAKRNFAPTVSPAHSDGFMVGIWIAFLHKALDFRWDPSAVLVRMCDPAVLPQEFYGIRAIKSDDRGFSIRFPASWLSLPLNGDIAPLEEGDLVGAQLDMLAPKGFVEAVQATLGKHINEKDLDADKAAELCGFSKPALSRRLAKLDTSIVEILTVLKMDSAKNTLALTNASIQNIALSLGYSDATAFSRAFRKRIGMSPRAYRQTIKAKELQEC
jgi:AraC-like DNA-binding protein